MHFFSSIPSKLLSHGNEGRSEIRVRDDDLFPPARGNLSCAWPKSRDLTHDIRRKQYQLHWSVDGMEPYSTKS